MSDLANVIEDIRTELAQMENLRGELNSLRDLHYAGVNRAQGSVLHDFYTGCERIFLSIARDIDQNVPQGERWHLHLLERMEIECETVRPEVISHDLALMLRSYLGFRHVFRNIYGYELQGERLHPLVEDFSKTMDRFQAELRTFADFLGEIQDHL